MKREPRAILPFGIAEGTQLAALTAATGAGAARATAAVHKRTNLILTKLRTWTFYTNPLMHGLRLFISQGNGRINTSGAPCGNVTSKQCNGQENRGHCGERDGVARRNAIE